MEEGKRLFPSGSVGWDLIPPTGETVPRRTMSRGTWVNCRLSELLKRLANPVRLT